MSRTEALEIMKADEIIESLDLELKKRGNIQTHKRAHKQPLLSDVQKSAAMKGTFYHFPTTLVLLMTQNLI